MRTFRCMHVNCFNRLRFLAEVNTILQKMHIQEGNMETWQMTPFFIYLFYLVRTFSLQHSFLYLKTVKSHFHVVPLRSIVVCKIPQFFGNSYRFGQPITLFWKIDTLRLQKNYKFCPPARAKYPFLRLHLIH